MSEKFRVEFTREVHDDAEFAVKNFPGLPLPEALREQFKYELDEEVKGVAPGLLPAYTLDKTNIDVGGNVETFTLTFDCGDRKPLSRDTQRAILRDCLQHHYDKTGMAGRFNILD